MGCGASKEGGVEAKYAAPPESVHAATNGSSEYPLLRTPRLPEAAKELEFHNQVAERNGKMAYDTMKVAAKEEEKEARQVRKHAAACLLKICTTCLQLSEAVLNAASNCRQNRNHTFDLSLTQMPCVAADI